MHYEERPLSEDSLTLPAAYLEAAERIAKERHVNLSVVVSEALERSLREEEGLRRSEAIVEAYKKAFEGFSPDELLLLDGVVLGPPEPEAPHRRTSKLPKSPTRARR